VKNDMKKKVEQLRIKSQEKVIERAKLA